MPEGVGRGRHGVVALADPQKGNQGESERHEEQLPEPHASPLPARAVEYHRTTSCVLVSQPPA
jgi:hypothetical protein